VATCFGLLEVIFKLWHKRVKYTGWSKSLCAPDDYNTESYK